MRRIIAPALFALCIGPSFALAETPEIGDWIEMAEVCETIVVTQEATSLDRFAPAPPLVNVKGLREAAIAHPEAPLVASAISQNDNWFLCVVAGNPPLEIPNAVDLIEDWSNAQRKRAEAPNMRAVFFNEDATIDPVRVRCGQDGSLVAIMGVKIDGAFRIGVTQNLPSRVANPCLDQPEG